MTNMNDGFQGRKQTQADKVRALKSTKCYRIAKTLLPWKYIEKHASFRMATIQKTFHDRAINNIKTTFLHCDFEKFIDNYDRGKVQFKQVDERASILQFQVMIKWELHKRRNSLKCIMAKLHVIKFIMITSRKILAQHRIKRPKFENLRQWLDTVSFVLWWTVRWLI